MKDAVVSHPDLPFRMNMPIPRYSVWGLTAVSWGSIWELLSAKESHLTQSHTPNGRQLTPNDWQVRRHKAPSTPSSWNKDNREGPSQLQSSMIWTEALAVTNSSPDESYCIHSPTKALPPLPSAGKHLPQCSRQLEGTTYTHVAYTWI